MKSFGVAKREGYDSRPFYARKLYDTAAPSGPANQAETALPEELVDAVLHRDSRRLPEIPDRSIHLVITSPPYNVGKDYDRDLSLKEYLALLTDVFTECRRILAPGGRICINVANLGRKPYIPLHARVIDVMTELGFLMRGEIIWDKSASAGSSTAWGSWKSAVNPTLRDVHEYIMVFSAETYGRERNGKMSTVTRDEFLELTKSLWSFPAESARRVHHPAPFPVELPYRLIQLYSFGDDVVFDPFAGSGSTGIAAIRAGRRFVLCDKSPAYVEVARERIRRFRETGEDRKGRPRRKTA